MISIPSLFSVNQFSYVRVCICVVLCPLQGHCGVSIFDDLRTLLFEHSWGIYYLFFATQSLMN